MKILSLMIMLVLSFNQLATAGLEKTSPTNPTELILKEVKKKFTVYNGTLTAPDPLTHEIVKIPFGYYRTSVGKEETAPLVIVYPSLSDEIPLVEKFIAKMLAKRGYNVMIANLSEDISDVSRPITKIDDFFLRSTANTTQLLDEILKRPEINPNRVFAIGVSLGGIRAALSLTHEPRITAGALYVAGGDLPRIFAKSTVGLIRNYRYHWMKKLGLGNVVDFEQHLRSTLRIDPLNLVGRRRTSEVMMVMGLKDRKVPYSNQLRLWEAFGRPKHITLPLQHRLAGASFLLNIGRIESFFRTFN